MTGKSPRPTNRSHFEKLISRVAREKGIKPPRLRRWISQMMILGAIDRAAAKKRIPEVVVKGGLTMELRFALSARATRDLDAIFSGSTQDVQDVLDEIFNEPYEGFLFYVTPPQLITNTDTYQCDVKLMYENRPWATEKFEFSVSDQPVETEQLSPIDLSSFGVNAPKSINCLAFRYQIAQKLHAVSAPWEDRENPRFRDIIDLILLSQLIDDFSPVKEACLEVFEARASHSWPPVIVAHESWYEPYKALATEIGIQPTDLESALEVIDQLIYNIDDARGNGFGGFPDEEQEAGMVVTPYFITDEGHSTTADSLYVYQTHKTAFGPVVEAFIFFKEEDSKRKGFPPYWQAERQGLHDSGFAYYPTLVLRNDRGGEMRLSGCNCGYGGTGPLGTEEILRSEGFPEHLIDLVATHSILHLHREYDSPLEAKLRQGETVRRVVRRRRAKEI